MPEPVISVRGEASLEVEPEIAIVWVSVQARDASRQRAVELLARRSGAVSSTIKGFGEAIEKLESQPVNVQPVFKDGRAGKERISGYLARAGFTVTVRDFARLAAAKDATQRAGEYAEAFGGRVTGLVEAADTGMLTPQPRHMAFAAKAAAAAGGDQGPAFDFEPAKQTVTAQVEARYTMTAPKFGT